MTDNTQTQSNDEPRYRHDFIVTLSGYGCDPEEAFEDALKAIEGSAPYYDHFTTDKCDVAEPAIFDTYPELLGYPINQYVDIEIHGVVDIHNDGQADEIECQLDDENPQFFSVYVRHKDGCSEAIADAGLSKLYVLREFAQRLADQNQWSYKDYTLGQAYWSEVSQMGVRLDAHALNQKTWSCRLCKQPAKLVFGTLSLCQKCLGPLPHIGTKIISLQGEISDTTDAVDVFTGINAEGVIDGIFPEQENCFSVVFQKGVGVFLSAAEITDKANYRIIKKHDVHCYAVVRVSARGIEAESHQAAIEKAEAALDFHAMLNAGADVEYAEMVIGHTVDESGDENYLNTSHYNAQYTLLG
jgi:hypothetical protein